ncbi:Pkinase-domain-containing protein [Microthyrium microscopicum]|uniref:Pkinase-domain-containing protein n=1 Tax=Microthyrium microscopicum TaxID=703497 RepID=A0A6A6UG51_9PEZI|nr:Pkinase-domain-containing protein [Microthyrium microscopicum]
MEFDDDDQRDCLEQNDCCKKSSYVSLQTKYANHHSSSSSVVSTDSTVVKAQKLDKHWLKDSNSRLWSLKQTIGRGSTGKVHLAECQASAERELVAIKSIPHGYSGIEQDTANVIRERARNEAAILSLLSHPSICSLRDVVHTPYHTHLFLEYIDGGQLLDYIIFHGRLKEKVARKLARQIASALEYCHKNKIVHRNLKLENILVTKAGDIKIIDFCCASVFSHNSLLSQFCGSGYFASPEFLKAQSYVGPEADVWSFGVVLYTLVCGMVPFDDHSMVGLHRKIKSGSVKVPNFVSTSKTSSVAC